MSTREERIIKLSKEHYVCPYCHEELSLCETPTLNVGDGLGWGEFFWLCLNDECSLFTRSWDVIKKRYGRVGSCRYVRCTDETVGTPMLVGSSEAFKGSVVNLEQLKRTEQTRNHKRTLELHEELNGLLDELAELNRTCSLTDNVCYCKTAKSVLENILRNYLVGTLNKTKDRNE